MTAVVWDEVGERRFETGVDRGVLYLPDETAVAWNGLTSISEETSREVKSFYLDGIKYLDQYVSGSYSARLQAFTYPEELEPLLGFEEFAPGVVVHDQRPKQFSLAYRTLIGNDVDGENHGYRLHIVYNVTASPTTPPMTSVGGDVAPASFEWALSGVPNQMFGIRPTGHISLNSSRIDPALLVTLEETLYGTEVTEPELPYVVDLLGMVEGV